MYQKVGRCSISARRSLMLAKQAAKEKVQRVVKRVRSKTGMGGEPYNATHLTNGLLVAVAFSKQQRVRVGG
jgi:hypothetical protein